MDDHLNKPCPTVCLSCSLEDDAAISSLAYPIRWNLTVDVDTFPFLPYSRTNVENMERACFVGQTNISPLKEIARLEAAQVF